MGDDEGAPAVEAGRQHAAAAAAAGRGSARRRPWADGGRDDSLGVRRTELLPIPVGGGESLSPLHRARSHPDRLNEQARDPPAGASGSRCPHILPPNAAVAAAGPAQPAATTFSSSSSSSARRAARSPRAEVADLSALAQLSSLARASPGLTSASPSPSASPASIRRYSPTTTTTTVGGAAVGVGRAKRRTNASHRLGPLALSPTASLARSSSDFAAPVPRIDPDLLRRSPNESAASASTSSLSRHAVVPPIPAAAAALSAAQDAPLLPRPVPVASPPGSPAPPGDGNGERPNPPILLSAQSAWSPASPSPTPDTGAQGLPSTASTATDAEGETDAPFTKARLVGSMQTGGQS